MTELEEEDEADEKDVANGVNTVHCIYIALTGAIYVLIFRSRTIAIPIQVKSWSERGVKEGRRS